MINNKFAFSLLSLALISQSSFAGFKELTWHSRANCLMINESISWEFGKAHWLKTVGLHYKGTMKPICVISDGWQNTWRSASIHWTEGRGGWRVCGDHYTLDAANQPMQLGVTCTNNCSIYDGWWDQEKPEDKRNTPPEKHGMSLYGNDDYLPKSGIHIVDPDKSAVPAELLLETSNKIKQMKSKGYFSVDSSRARELLVMSDPNYIDGTEQYETGLKKNLGTIKLAFRFTPIKDIPNDDVIGYAAAGTFIDQKGWTGVGEFYRDKNLRICHYLVNNIALTGGGINLRRDLVSYEVNDKPTNIISEGNDQSGYITTISWYSNEYIKTIECASPHYDKNIKTYMIEVAMMQD